LKSLIVAERVGTVGVVGATVNSHVGIARPTVAVDQDLDIIVEIGI